MASDREELNKRRKAREEQRKRRKRQQQKLYGRLALAGVILLVCGLMIFVLSRGVSQKAEETEPVEVIMAEGATVPTEATYSRFNRPDTVVHIVAGGDLNVTDKVVWAGQTTGQTTGRFDYTEAFLDVAGILSEADLAVLNLEGNFVGAPYGSEKLSAPQELAEGLKLAGVDLIQMANSTPVKNGLLGLTSTLSAIRAAGMEPVGAFSSVEEFKKTKGYTLCDVQGITIAFVAFTKGVGSLGMPTGSEDCVNMLYTDYSTTYQKVDTEGIQKVLKNVAAEKPDLTIALLHWGSEYNDVISSTQEKIVTLMQDGGVDVIIGTHPHMVHEISFDETTGQLVAYSLGDFFGDASRSGTNYSILLDLEITLNGDSGTARVTDYSYTPIYTLTEEEGGGQRRVVRIREAMGAYDANFVDKISASAYENMKYALTRISDRVRGKY